MMRVSIRQAVPQDVPGVAALFIASQADALPFVAKLHTPEDILPKVVCNVFFSLIRWQFA
jgi:hypothetical protein